MTLQARMSHPAQQLPAAMKALFSLKAATQHQGVDETTLALVELRASQINGCGACVDMHARAALKAGESAERLFAVAAWREVPGFSDAERAALALTEALTRISDRPEPVSDDVWNEAAHHYDEKALSALLLAIANINVWNRLNVAVRQPAGAWKA
ncbi:carboxymuconolactone decarboxylase family protein [Lysobacter enzymogenes]|uniref:carboxymuconolactone decarboxylase family protein n=1 Tax=Lysobacter enzymogenes TaxID=69 RepID=UPI00089C5A55|nr:carboxymuconolactone decarboxylase family protein [Lysobacter enzymogenes]SDW52953.1 alkylhydroperoxidase AhpD family core domain-containing protein [Lysobacter enzymogenes]